MWTSGPAGIGEDGGSGSADEGDGEDEGGASDGAGSGFDSGSGIECDSDEDCPPGEHCGEASGECLGPTGCVFDGDCDEGFTCEEGECSIGGDCGGFAFELTRTEPNLMVLLDRSGSMSGDVSGTGLNRWEVATEAIFQVTTEFDADIRFGLTTYSSCIPGGCSAGTTEVGLAPNNAAAIQAFLDTTKGAGSLDGQGVGIDGLIRYLCDSGRPETSTGVSLQGLVGDPSLQDETRPNAVLLLTDGGESSECTGQINGPGGALALFSQDPPVRTFAVGMGGASLAQLEQIAIAGGTAEAYFADEPASLQQALGEIAGSVASCTFSLDEVPPDAAMIYVFFDLDPAGVPNDGMNGWTYDPVTNSITFHGTSCTALQDGSVVDVDIVYGCDQPPAG